MVNWRNSCFIIKGNVTNIFLLTLFIIIITDTLFGQLPMLEGDGMTICQSNTINRYLANKFGMCLTLRREKRKFLFVGRERERERERELLQLEMIFEKKNSFITSRLHLRSFSDITP